MKTHPLENLSEQYLMAKELAPRTLKTYRIVYKHFTKYLKDRNILYATTPDVIAYKERKRSLGYSSHWLYIQVSALKGLYRYLKLHQRNLNLPDAYAYDIMEPVKNEQINARIKKPILTIDQARTMILQTQKRRKYVWHYRDHAIIYLMLTSGLSRQDIVHVKRRDYQFRSGEAILYLGYQEEKIEENFVKLASGAKRALDDYLSRRYDDNPYLFISHKKVSPTGHLSRTFFRYMFRQVLKDTGLEGSGITPHCLRHTAATFNLLRGGTLSQTKSFMRHVDIKSTMVYQDYVERMQDQTEYELEAFLLKEEVTEYNGDLISLLNILFE